MNSHLDNPGPRPPTPDPLSESGPRPPTPGPRPSLLRVLGVTFGLAVIIGNTIGVGILRAPGQVAAELPDVRMFVGAWLVGGLYALLGANSLAELGTLLPKSGGQYVFARRAFGDYAGFVVGWSDWISTCGTVAAVTIAMGEYVAVVFPGMLGREILTAVAVTMAFAFLQWRGIRWGSATQNLTSLLKAVAFVALVIGCFALGSGGAFSEATPNVTSTSPFVLLAFVVALQAIIYTYDGWTGVIYFSEEVREPGRDIPRSMFGGVLAVIAIYLLVNLAFLYVLPITTMAGQSLVAGTAADALFGARGGTIIHALAIIGLLSSVNALLLIATRVPYAMGRDRLFPERAVRVNAGGTPTIALALSAIVAVAFILSKRFNEVIAVLAFFFVANYTISFAALFVLRRQEPNAPRPFRAWGYPWTTAVALLGSIAFLAGAVATDTWNSLYALAVLAASYPSFLLVRRLAGEH